MTTPTVISVEVVDASGSNSAGNSITVPVGTTQIFAYHCLWDGSNAMTMSSLTLDAGVEDFDYTGLINQANDTGAPYLNGVSLGQLNNPTIGAGTLTHTWSAGTPAEGGGIYLVYCKDGDLTASGVRSSGVDRGSDAAAVSITVTSNTADLVIGFGQSFNSFSKTPLFVESPTALHQDNSLINSEYVDVGSFAGIASFTLSMLTADSNYSNVTVLSLKEAGATSSTLNTLTLLGVG